MLLLGVILLLVLPAGVIAVLARRNPEIGSTWMIAAGAGALAWLILAGTPLRFFQEITITGWVPTQGYLIKLQFQLDKITWPYALSIIALNIAVMLTSSARIHVKNESFLWAGSLLLTGIGVLACSTLNPLSLILVWTLLDIAELGFILFIRSDRRIESAGLLSFTWRVFGSLILAGVIILAGDKGQPASFPALAGKLLPAVLLAVILRLGIFPLHQGFSQSGSINRSAGNVINLIAPATALVLLGRIPIDFTGYLPVLLILLILIYAIFTALQWSTSSGELHGRAFWVFTVAILAIFSTINGQPQFSAVWGMILLIGGGSLFLASPRNKWVSILLMVVFFGISGIPGSASMTAWKGILNGAPVYEIPFFILIVTILYYGYIRFLQTPEGDFSNVDRWVKVVYPTGIGVLILTQWVVFIRTLPTSFTMDFWWCSVLVVLLTLLVFIWRMRKFPERINRSLSKIEGLFEGEAARTLGMIFRFGWLTRIINGLFSLIQQFIGFITSVLEGEGGILWAILLLALLISYFQFGFKP
jgi:hypothetical protein